MESYQFSVWPIRPEVRIPKDAINRNSGLLYAKTITINVNNDNLPVLHMISEFNSLLKNNYQFNKLQMKRSLFKIVNPRCSTNLFSRHKGCIED